MAQTLSVERISRQKWDELTPTFRDSSFRQCSSYASAAARHVGARSELAALMDEKRMIGLAEVRIKKIPMTSVGIAYSNYAPIVMQDEHSYEQQFGRSLAALQQEYVERRRLVLRVTPALNGGMFQDVQKSCFEDTGFYPSRHQPARQTFMIDLEPSSEDIRRSFDSKWRSDLARSEKAGITITRSVQLSDFDQFNQIFLELATRKGFMPSQDLSFFKSIQSEAPPGQQFVLHLAWHSGELVAGHLGSFVGNTAVYLLGASNAKGRDLRASYLLQWEAILYGKSIGNSFYDLGGIDQKNNPDVYRFKRRLNGRLVSEIGPYECAPGTISKHVIQIADRARRAIARHHVQKG
jgi:lipid II:glycine glycyltransferase (peptidoglycan interpeptide bridge formation enzyme)